MRDLNSIISQIIQNNQRYWKLYVRDGYKDRFEDSDFQAEDITVERAVEMLKERVYDYRQDKNREFSIELHTTNRGSSGTGKTDKIPFVADNNETSKSEKTENGLPALNTLAGLQSTYSHGQQVYADIRQMENQLNQRELDFRDRVAKKDIEILMREMELKRKEEEVRKQEEKIKELEAEYTSHSQKVAKGVMSGIENVLYGFMEKGNITPVTTSPDIGAVETQDLRTQSQTGSLIESIATNVFDKLADSEEIKAWGLITQKFIEHPESPEFSEYIHQAKKIFLQVQKSA